MERLMYVQFPYCAQGITGLQYNSLFHESATVSTFQEVKVGTVLMTRLYKTNQRKILQTKYHKAAIKYLGT